MVIGVDAWSEVKKRRTGKRGFELAISGQRSTILVKAGAKVGIIPMEIA